MESTLCMLSFVHLLEPYSFHCKRSHLALLIPEVDAQCYQEFCMTEACRTQRVPFQLIKGAISS